MAKLERIYTIPLGDAFRKPRNQRAPRAVKLLREFAAKHMKADGRVVVSEMLNMFIWERSIQKPPRHVKVRLIKEDGEVRAYLADEKIEEPKKEKKEEKKPEAKKEEPKKEPEKKAEKEEAPEKAPEKKETAPKKEATKKEEAKDKK